MLSHLIKNVLTLRQLWGWGISHWEGWKEGNVLWKTAQLLLIEDQCDLEKGEVVLQCVGGGSGAGALLGCSSCAWDEPGREAAPWALPCRPPTMLPAGRVGSHRGGQ